MASFLSTDNPLALVVGFIVVFLLLRYNIGKPKINIFKKERGIPEAWVIPVVIIACLFIAANVIILKIIAAALPLFTLLAVVIVMGSLVFVSMGLPSKLIMRAFEHPQLIFLLKIVGAVIIIYAGSLAVGQQLLDDKSVTLGGGTGFSFLDTSSESGTQIDVAHFFSAGAIGFIFLVVIGLLAVLFVRGMWIFG